MEKSEGRKQGSSPRSSSRRTYSIFSSIINLSSTPGVKITDGSSPQSSPNNTGVVSSRTYHDQKSTSSDASKKKKGNQSSSGSQTVGSSSSGSGSSSGLNGPIGPAPRTLSILTALNELAISDQTGVVDSAITPDSHHLSRAYSIPTINAKNDGSCQIQVNSNFYPKASSSSDQQLTTSTSLKRDDFHLHSPSSSHAFASIPRKLRGHDKEIHLKRTTTKRSQSKERTPDWIWKIFQLAKHGRLDELQQSLKGLDPLDPTLIRHLVDGKGNTLLHYAARGGHVQTLQWLVSILGSHTDAVLNDKNRAGRSVILTALKGGQLQCFQWLVLQTICGDKALVAKEGEQSLLHFAANYKNEAAVKWLSEQLKRRNIGVDIKDSAGMTPLHMAGRSGSVSICHELIKAGASPLAQTELGWRPSDLALRHHHIECANYLIMSEAAGSLGNELYNLLCSFRNLRQEHESLRLNFREVLRVGKWLVKERVDLIKNFPSKSSPEAALLLGGASGNGARFSALEHKLVKAEQAWKKMEQSQVDKFPMTPAPGSGPTATATTTTTNTTNPSTSTLGDTEAELERGTASGSTVDFTIQNINSSDVLQKRLAGLQSLLDRSFSSDALLSASSSEAESSASGASSSEDDHHPTSRQPYSQQQQQHHHHHHPPRRQASRYSNPNSNASSPHQPLQQSPSAPWLLRPDDSLLSHLSPVTNQLNRSAASETSTSASLSASSMDMVVPNLDLLRMAQSNSNASRMFLPSVIFGNKDSSGSSRASDQPSPKSSKRYVNVSDACETTTTTTTATTMENESPSAAVLEVIEPHRSPNKKGEDGVRRLFVSSASRSYQWPSEEEGKSWECGGDDEDDGRSYGVTAPTSAATAVSDRRSSCRRDKNTQREMRGGSQECQLVHLQIPSSSSSSSSRPPPRPRSPPAAAGAYSGMTPAASAPAFMRSHPPPGDSPAPLNAPETMTLSLSSSIENEKKESCRSRRRAKFKREDDKRSSPILSHSSSGFVSSTTKDLENVYLCTLDLIRGTRQNSKSEITNINESVWTPSRSGGSSNQHASVIRTEDPYSDNQEISWSHSQSTHLRQSNFLKNETTSSMSKSNVYGSYVVDSNSNSWIRGLTKSGESCLSSDARTIYPAASTSSPFYPPQTVMGKYLVSPASEPSSNSYSNSKIARSCENLYSSSPVNKIVPTPSSSSTPLHHVNHGASFPPLSPPPLPPLNSHPSKIFSSDTAAAFPHSGPLLPGNNEDDNHNDDGNDNDNGSGKDEKDERRLEDDVSEDNSENHTCGPSLQVPNESASSSNTPLMTRSLSSISRASTTLVFPLSTGPWTNSNDIPPSTTPESSLEGRLSPSPSEASRTESALVPPPSHTSQNSEISKTESAQDHEHHPAHHHHHHHHHHNHNHHPPLNFLQSSLSESAQDEAEMCPDSTDAGSAAEGQEMDHRNCNNNYSLNSSHHERGDCERERDHERDHDHDHDHDLGKTGSNVGLSGAGDGAVSTSVTVPTAVTRGGSDSDVRDTTHRALRKKGDLHENRPDGETDEDEFRRGSRKAGSLTHNIQAAPCMIRPRVSTGIPKKTIHRVTKGTRGPPKPWYEVDGSDEEGSHLLRVARSSRSSCLSMSSFSTDSEDESDERSDEHSGSCPQHNCPDFV